MDDVQAIRRLKNGDIGGLESLIARYQARAMRTAYLVTHTEPLAEEVVQDAFIRFYEHAGQFDERRAFEPYFLRMVVYAALNAVERESRFVRCGGRHPRCDPRARPAEQHPLLGAGNSIGAICLCWSNGTTVRPTQKLFPAPDEPVGFQHGQHHQNAGVG